MMECPTSKQRWLVRLDGRAAGVTSRGRDDELLALCAYTTGPVACRPLGFE